MKTTTKKITAHWTEKLKKIGACEDAASAARAAWQAAYEKSYAEMADLVREVCPKPPTFATKKGTK